MISEEGNDQRDSTWNQPAIAHPADMISNHLTHLSYAPIARVFITRQQQLTIVWYESQLIATSITLQAPPWTAK